MVVGAGGGVGSVRDVEGLMGSVSASVGHTLYQRSSSSCSQCLDTFNSCSLFLGRTVHRGNDDPLKNH